MRSIRKVIDLRKEHRMIRRPPLPLILIGLAVFMGCDDNTIVAPPGPDTVRVSFQDGVLPTPIYQGTADAVLKNGPQIDQRNGNFGAAHSDTVGVLALSSDLFERRLIIRMDLSSITNCSQVLSAHLSIYLAPGAHAGMPLEAHRVALPDDMQWMEGAGGLAAGVSWTTMDGSAPWAAEGGDFDSAVIDQVTVVGDTVIFTLEPSLVRGWILRPASNHGIIIKAVNVSEEVTAIAYLRDFPVASLRPRLDIAYLPGG